MQFSKALTHIGRNDARVISRDSFLLLMTGYILGITILMRYALPWLNNRLAANDAIPFALATHYPMLIAFIALFNGALLGGTIVGFVLLEEREDGTIQAMLVTPLPVPTYLSYRVLLPTVFGFMLVTAQMLILSNLVALSFWQMLLLALGASLTAPIASLFFASFAENRVQGFALMKFTGIGGFVIAGGWFVAEPLQYLFGLFPPFWVSKAYWMTLNGSTLWWAALGLGVGLQLALIAWLMRRFNNVIYRDT